MHRPFRGLLGVHSHYGLHTRAVTVYRDTLSEGFSHFVTSIAAPVASGWSGCRVGFHPLESAALSRRTGIADIREPLLVCRVSDAGRDGGCRELWRPASESLQGRKPRVRVRTAVPQALWGFERRGRAG